MKIGQSVGFQGFQRFPIVGGKYQLNDAISIE